MSLVELPVCRRPAVNGMENRRQAFVWPPTMAMLLHAWGLLEARLDDG